MRDEDRLRLMLPVYLVIYALILLVYIPVLGIEKVVDFVEENI